MSYYLGLDIGSISVNAVIMDAEKKIVENKYEYCKGKPFHILANVVSE
jgi:activator of 2-hydroxyglutaryl-CoA dehydratase